jgi:hypothetical protein
MPGEMTFESAIVDMNPQLREEPLLASLKNRLRTVSIDGQTLFVAEGDLLMDEDQLAVYADEQKRLKEVQRLEDERVRLGLGDLSVIRPFSSQLVGMTQGGKIVRWGPGVKLSYCVLRSTFSNDSEYRMVRENMTKATRDWEQTCGVQFEYKQALDNSPTTTPPGVLFTVRGIDAGGRFIAAAFFPTDPQNRRRMLIDPSYFTTSFDQVGVLRHELGHVLGFRHEHIRSGAPAACPGESLEGTINLTDYDPQSVMHYFCGGVGSQELTITEVDKEGARKVYGLPLDKHLFMTVDVDQPAGLAPHLPAGGWAALSDPSTARNYNQLREISTEELLEELRRRASP